MRRLWRMITKTSPADTWLGIFTPGKPTPRIRLASPIGVSSSVGGSSSASALYQVGIRNTTTPVAIAATNANRMMPLRFDQMRSHRLARVIVRSNLDPRKSWAEERGGRAGSQVPAAGKPGEDDTCFPDGSQRFRAVRALVVGCCQGSVATLR